MRKHCGNCANHRKETNTFSEECGMCVQSVFENGEKTDPSHWREKPQTNADRIRAMSDEELAKIIICPKQVCDKLHILVGRTDCEACSLEWLKQPADMRGEKE